MKVVIPLGLVALIVFVSGVVGHQTSNCTAEYMDDLLRQALQVKEQCDLKGRYDCCKVCGRMHSIKNDTDDRPTLV